MTNLPASLHSLDNPFNFSDRPIRTALDERGEGWFCAKDVFEALDVTWSGKKGSLRNCPEEWIRLVWVRTLAGGNEAFFLSEPGVYKVAFSSRKPEAERFCNWVCKEVLPAIRRHGFYGHLNAGQQIALANHKLRLIKELNTADAFVFDAVLTSLRNVCNQLGEPMPDPALIGKDRHQLALGV